VGVRLGVVGELVLLVEGSVLGRGGTGADVGIIVLGDLLVGLLGSLGTSALDGLGDVVAGVLMDKSWSVRHALHHAPGAAAGNIP
jgi:hypothetical protein